MASPAIDAAGANDDSDYGSDFSPEEVTIVQRLLSGHVEIEDNPIVNVPEYHEAGRTLRFPHIFSRGERSPIYQAARSAEQVAEQINSSVKAGKYPDCKCPVLRVR